MKGRELLEDNIVVVLNEPQDRVNIAGTIRAMMNTGLRRLRLVDPAEWDEYRIEGIAHGSEIVRDRAEFFDTLDDALADAVEVVGTTARRRAMRHQWEHPRDGVEEILSLATDERGPVCIVFGREDIGLTNEQLDRCDRIWTVPTDPERPSLNLAQAALLVCYELWIEGPGSEKPLPRPRRDAPPATTAHLEEVFEHVDRHLRAINFYRGGKNPEAVLRTLRAIVRRAGVDEREAELIRAVSARTWKELERRSSLRRSGPGLEARGPGYWGQRTGAGGPGTGVLSNVVPSSYSVVPVRVAAWSMRFKFEDLRVWQDALDYGDTAYGLIAQLPASERFDLAEQFRKAATSIALNIAEGRGYRVDSDQLELADQQIAVLFRRLQAFRRSLRES